MLKETKRRLHNRKTEHFKALTKCDNLSAIVDHINTTGHNIKWDRLEILDGLAKLTSIEKSRRLYLFKCYNLH